MNQHSEIIHLAMLILSHVTNSKSSMIWFMQVLNSLISYMDLWGFRIS